MSSLPEIQVKADTPEAVVDDLLRMEALDGKHAQEHKATGNQDSCHICVKLRNQMRFYAESKTMLSTVGEAVERTAKTLAKQESGVKWAMVTYDHEFYWETALNAQQRHIYRLRATELVYDLFGSELRFWSL